MKKLFLLFSICCLAVSYGFSQDDVYYTGDEATVSIKAETPPPALPTYVQPPCPYEGYLWTPGYWAWAAAGYYWVPGVWINPPHMGYLWTPGYWGFYHGYYGWHGGYWGEHIGYYGGVNYGFGYGGVGFYGGRWEGNSFRYNTAVVSVNTSVVHNTYVSNEHVSASTSSHASFNGPNGVQAHPIASEQVAANENHVQPTSEQQSHQVAASNDKAAFASANHGKPATAAMATPGGQRFSAAGHATTSSPSNGAQKSASSAKTQQTPRSNNAAHAPAKHAPAPAHSSGGHSGGGGRR
jgi:hypothetical protein